MRLPWTALLCAGCPYLWGPPEFADVGSGATDSGEPETDVDTDTDADSDADVDADTDTDTGTPPDPDPQVLSFTATLYFGEVELRFELADPGGLRGASVALDVDGTPYVYDVDALATWSGAVGTVRFPEAVSCDPFTRSYTLVATDADGHPSAPAAAALTVTPVNLPEADELLALGTLPVPSVLCATLGNQSEVDDWELSVDPGGDWKVTITYASPQDRDLVLLDSLGQPLVRSEDLTVPDSFRFLFVVGTVYRLRIEQTVGGPGDDYTVVISP